MGHKERDPPRGSLRSFTAQRTLAQDDNQKRSSGALADSSWLRGPSGAAASAEKNVLPGIRNELL
jgi:hypothetical protein